MEENNELTPEEIINDPRVQELKPKPYEIDIIFNRTGFSRTVGSNETKGLDTIKTVQEFINELLNLRKAYNENNT